MRFLALVSNGERLAELSEKAANAEDAATLQVLKTMDSIDAKTQQLQTSLQSLYVSSGVQNFFKGILDFGNEIVKTFTRMPTVLNQPIPAILKIGTTFASLANVVTNVFAIIKSKLNAQASALTSQEELQANRRVVNIQNEMAQKEMLAERLAAKWKAIEAGKTREEAEQARARVSNAQQEAQQKMGLVSKKSAAYALGLNIAGVALSTISASLNDKTRSNQIAKGLTGIAGSAASMAGMGLTMSGGQPIGAIIGAGLGTAMGIVENLNFLIETTAAKTSRLKEAAENAKNTYLQKNAEAKNLQEQIDKLKELEETQNESAEARKEFLELSNAIASSNPELVGTYDSEGNAIISLTRSYRELAKARGEASDALDESIKTSMVAAKNAIDVAERNRLAQVSQILETRGFGKYNRGESDAYGYNFINRNTAADFYRTELLYNDIEGVSQEVQFQISELLKDLANRNWISADFKLKDNNVKQGLEILNEKAGTLGETIYQLIDDYIAGLADVDRNIAEKRATYKNLEQSNLIDKINDSNLDKRGIENEVILNNFSEASNLINNYMLAQFDNWKEQLSKTASGEIIYDTTYNSALEQFLAEEYENFYNNIYTALQDFWANGLITESRQNEIINLLNNRKNYTQDQLKERIASILGIEVQQLNSSLITAIEGYYKDSFNLEEFNKRIGELATKQAERSGNFLKIRTPSGNLTNQLGESELNKIYEIYSMLDQGITDKKFSAQRGQEILKNYLRIWDATTGLDDTTREIAQGLIGSVDDLSLDNLKNLRNDIKELNISETIKQTIFNFIDNLLNFIPVNLNTELQNYSTVITEKMSDFEKAISNASKGMDLKTASELAAKIGKSLSEFDLRDGKFYFDDLSAIEEAYLGAAEQSREAIKEAAKKIKNSYTSTGNKQDLSFIFKNVNSEEELNNAIESSKNALVAVGIDPNQLKIYYQEYLNDVDKGTQEFVDWIGEHIDEQLKESLGITDDYIKSIEAQSALSSGNISKFLNATLGQAIGDNAQEERKILEQQILSNNYSIEELPKGLQAWASALQISLKDIQKNIFDSAITSLTKGVQIIDVNDTNRELLNSLSFVKISEDGKTAFIDATKENIKEIRNDILTAVLSEEDKNALLASLHKEEFKNSAYSALNSIVDKFDSFTYEAGQSLASALGTDIDTLIKQHIVQEDSAGNLSTSYDQMLSYLNQTMSELGTKQYNDLRAKLEAANDKQQNETIFKDIIKNRESLNATNISDLANMLKVPYDTALALLKNNNGTYSIDLNRIQTLINQGKITVTDEIKELMADEIDKVISSITGLVGNQSKGYTNLADMQKYADELNKATGNEYGFRDLFEYNNALHAYQLSTNGLIAQIKNVKNQLNNMSDEQKEVAKRLIDDTTRQFAELIDVSGYLSLNDNDPAKTIKEQEVMRAIHDYNTAIEALGEGTILYTEQIINSLKTGGLNAVEAARKIAEAAGKTLTADDVETAYRSEVSQLVNAFEQLVYEPGTIIDNVTADILEEANFGIKRIEGTGQALITSIGNINEAYKIYLDKLGKSGEATLVDLNEAAVKALESNDAEEMQAIELLSKAADMSYSEFAKILTEAGIKLSTDMIDQLESQNIIKHLGGGKMQVTNWDAFVGLMNWTDLNSEEYVSAFKSYNDALVEMNHKVERNITEEIKSIENSKAGDVVNLTQLTSELNDEVENSLKDKLESFGAILTNGLLLLDDNANIPAIIQTIVQEAAENGLLLQDNMAELADTLNNVLENYTNLIANGIEGKLTNTQALDLQTQARSMNFAGNLDFIKTADGLKLSSDSAASLYAHLKNIDTIKSNLVLDKLYNSITSSDERLKTMSGTMNRISEIQKQIEKNEKAIYGLRTAKSNDKADAIERENEKLRDQLQLYKDIRYEQMDDADSYAFMDRALPEQFQGAENYFNSIGKAFKAINEAGESGFMEIADFYNFINEASELVGMSGKAINLWGMEIDGSAETCAALIQRGFGALSNIDGEGVKVDLQRLGANFQSGADGMASDFKAGIKAMAKSQIELIDAEIAMLETFVAMEALGDIDVDKSGTFDFTEEELGLLDKQTGYLESYGKGLKSASEKLKKFFDESDDENIKNLYNNFKVNGLSLHDIIEAILNDNIDALKEANIKGEDFKNLLTIFYDLYGSDEFAESPAEILKYIEEKFANGDLGDLAISFEAPGIEFNIQDNYGIDFNSAATQAAEKYLKEHGITDENLEQTLRESFKKYKAGTATPVELTATMIAKGVVKVEDDGLDVISEDGTVEHFDSENSEGYKEAVQKAASIKSLRDIGAKGEITYDEKTVTAKGKIVIGDQEITVSSQNGKTQYHSSHLNKDFNSIDDLLHEEFRLDPNKNRDWTFEEWKSANYHTHLNVNATVESTSNETELKDNIWKILNSPKELVENAIIEAQANDNNVNANGTITVDVQGTKITIDNIGDLEQKTEAAYTTLKNTVDPDGMITKISTAITNAFSNMNIAQLFIDGLTQSLNVQQNEETGVITFTENPTITALGENLGKGMAGSIAAAAGAGIQNYFNTEGNKAAITTPLKTGVESAAESTEVTDADYTIPSATATLTKMTIDQVDEVGFSSPSLGDMLKSLISGTKKSDLTLESATAAIKKLSLVSVDETDLQTQLTAEIEAKIEPIDVSSITTANDAITQTIATVSASLNTLKDTIGNLDTNSINANTSATGLNTTLTNISNSTGPARAEDFKKSLNDIDSTGPNRAFSFKEAVNAIANYGPSYAASFVKSVNSIENKTVKLSGSLSLNAYLNAKGDIQADLQAGPLNASFAKGNTDTKKHNIKGNNKTLVGELGPELVVSNGRYYVVGENGAEMVDLPDDAIVFNHIQTKKLLGTGKGGRGTPVTNERNAVSYATGNVSGPAMVSAQAAIASLKQLRAMWESMLNASAKQLGSQAGKTTKTSKDTNSGTRDTDTSDLNDTRIKTTTAEIQRWYNLLRQIDKTEKDITYQEKLQTQYQSLRVADGESLYKSYKAELGMLDQQIARSKELADLQKDWYDTKRAELAASAYGKIFRYTEDGLQQYVDGANRGLDILEKLTATDIWGNPTGHARTAESQLSYIKSLGFNLNDLLSNSDGTKVGSYIGGTSYILDENGQMLEGQDLINAQASIMENFWDNIDGWRDELDGLYDSYREQLSDIVDNQNKQNDIMQKVVDNQIEVENKVYQALVDARQAIIDRSQKELEAYQKNSEDMIESLNNSLEKERQLYNNQQNSNELLKLQRQLAILQRSGGSTSQILNLQNQIATKQQDMYFDEKEQQIQALQEASDLQIEKMEEQIALMTETLEYEKENGLLWKQVYDVMQRSPEEILDFISKNSANWASNSALQISQTIADLQTKIEVYVSSRNDDFLSYYNDLSSSISELSGVINSQKNEVSNSSNNDDDIFYFDEPNNYPTPTPTVTMPHTDYTNNNYNDNNDYNNYTPFDTPSNYNRTARLNEGSTTTYKMGSGGYFKGASKSIGHRGDEVTVIEENAGSLKDGRQVSLIEYKGKQYYIRNERLAYKNGGLIDFTGPAWVDGTPSKPEAILNAGETKFIQNNLPNFLSNIDTLQERLKDMQELQTSWLNSILHLGDNDQNNGVNIEHVELNMTVEQMSNTTDAKKVGKEVLDELLNLSRKTGRNSISRR